MEYQCSNNLGELVPIPTGGCRNLGVSGEWRESNNMCERINFLGNPTQCLMLNLSGITTCFDNIGATCDPSYRESTIPVYNPRQQVLDYCTGADGGDWMSRWYGNGSCTDLIYNQMGYTSSPIEGCFPRPTVASTNTIYFLRTMINRTIEQYVSEGYKFPAVPGTDGYNNFQERLYQIFCNYPILGNQSLRVACSKYSVNDIIANPSLADMCGCYLSPDSYQDYINPQCAPSCNNGYAVKLTDITNSILPCENGTICYIGEDTISLLNSRGDISINQICGECSGNCNCIVSDNTIIGINSQEINVNLNQVCGSITTENGTLLGLSGLSVLRYSLIVLFTLIILIAVITGISIWRKKK